MTDLDTLRPEVQTAFSRLNQDVHLSPQSFMDWTIIRSELLRLAGVEAELAALKAKIAVAPIVDIANIGDPFIVLPDHLTVPNSMKGQRVRLVVEE